MKKIFKQQSAAKTARPGRGALAPDGKRASRSINIFRKYFLACQSVAFCRHRCSWQCGIQYFQEASLSPVHAEAAESVCRFLFLRRLLNAAGRVNAPRFPAVGIGARRRLNDPIACG
jgi:hypothetical protein